MASSFTCLVLAVGAVGCSMMGGRSGQSAPEVHSFPTSVQPALHDELLGLIRGERPFSDKQLRKIAVTEDFGSWIKDGGVQKQALRASVAVFDSQNSKCWVWSSVYFTRPRDGHINFAAAKPDVNEIDCSLVAQ